MSYSQPIPLVFTNSTEGDFGDGTPTAWRFKGPKGKQGMLKDSGLHITETFNGDQVTGKVLVGDGSDTNYYGQLEVTDGTAATETWNAQDDTNAVIIEALPADTQIEVTYVGTTDTGTNTGKAFNYIETFWY